MFLLSASASGICIFILSIAHYSGIPHPLKNRKLIAHYFDEFLPGARVRVLQEGNSGSFDVVLRYFAKHLRQAPGEGERIGLAGGRSRMK